MTMTKNLLIAITSESDPSYKIGEVIAQAMHQADVDIEIVPFDSVYNISAYDACIIGGHVKGEDLSPSTVEFVIKHQEKLTQQPLAVFLTYSKSHQSLDLSPSTKTLYLQMVVQMFPRTPPVGVGLFSVPENLPMSQLMGGENRVLDEFHLWKTVSDWTTEIQHELIINPLYSRKLRLNLKGVIFAFTDLSHINLRGSDLQNANLSNAILNGTIFEEADLRGANLTDSQLRRANLQNAQLNWATMNRCNLQNANLSGANLISISLQNSDLSFANLSNCNLHGADLRFAHLPQVDLSLADLSYANLGDTNLSQANFSYANLCWTSLARAELTGAVFDNITYNEFTEWPDSVDISLLNGTLVKEQK